MSNVLLVDTNFSAGPIYQFLIQAGHHVTVVGSNPKDALAKCVDDYVNIDYTNIDKIKKLIFEKKIDYLVPGCNDQSYLVCSEINSDDRFPNIDPIEASAIINNKGKFREFAAQHGLPAPRVLEKHEIGTRWPVIVKPVDAYSGLGVTILMESNKEELESALNHASEVSRTKTYIVEDYVDGQLYSHTAFIQDGLIIVDHIVEEYCTANPFVVDTSRVIYDFPHSMLNSIRIDIHLLADQLRLKNGLIHTQFISNGSQYWHIEITRRCPGDLYSQLIEMSTGLNYAENYSRPFLGVEFSFRPKNKPRWIMRHTLTQPCKHTLGSIEFNKPLDIKKLVPISQTGDQLDASPRGRIAILFSEESTEKKLKETLEVTLLRKLYTIKKY